MPCCTAIGASLDGRMHVHDDSIAFTYLLHQVSMHPASANPVSMPTSQIEAPSVYLYARAATLCVMANIRAPQGHHTVSRTMWQNTRRSQTPAQHKCSRIRRVQNLRARSHACERLSCTKRGD